MSGDSARDTCCPDLWDIINEQEAKLASNGAQMAADAALINMFEQENERLRRAADVVVKTYDYVTGWTTEMDNAVCDLIRILESSDALD